MPANSQRENDFLIQINELIEANISNEQFGVSDLAAKIGMSRSNLLRKIKKLTDLSASQYIRNQRLKKAKILLIDSSYHVSEVSYMVGFGSPSYFIKCFGEYYGYPPGEEGNKNKTPHFEVKSEKSGVKRTNFLWGIPFVVLFTFVAYFLLKPEIKKVNKKEKSIAVLPFINDSVDSTNTYFINGLMEAILGHLQNIEDLRVISRTSVEKYRNKPKSVSEIGKELNVSYVLEGSGQKIDDEILLNLQLIEAESDKRIWADQYKRKFSNVFALQSEIATNVADKIKASVTPEEIENIEKASTDNLLAYDFFLQGLDLLNYPTPENLKASIPWFQKAIQEDYKYARAYAAIAISYFTLDEGMQFKKYTDSVNFYADKALLYDSNLPQSQIAKGLYYNGIAQYKLAESFFEKALKLRPNYDLALVFLVKLYSSYMPDTEKYLNYALFGNQMDIAAYDSSTTSLNYLHLSNALIQSGFQEEAEKFINKSLLFNPENLYSQYVKAYILFAKNRNLEATKKQLLDVLLKDTTRLDVLQEVAKLYYYQKDYKNAYKFYRPFVDAKRMYKLSIYPSEDIKIAKVFSEVGQTEEAAELLENFKTFASNSNSAYKHLYQSYYFAQVRINDKALEHFQLFSKEEKIQYWTVLFTPIEPVLENLYENAKFKNSMFTIEANFRKYHRRIRSELKGMGLL